MRRARPTASMSAARRRSRAARCRCWPQRGSYANSTTYTIVRATGGVSGTYAGVTSNFAFLTPNALPTTPTMSSSLCRYGTTAFTPSFLALTPNQRGSRRRPQPVLPHRQRRLRHRAGGDRRPQHHTGPAGAEHDQRRALCRLRHHEYQQQRDVHERAGPADGQRARRLLLPASARHWRRPARSRAAIPSVR